MIRRPVAALLVAGALTLAGCGGTSPAAAPSPVASPSAGFPSGLDTTAPTAPTGMTRTPASAVAFATYVARLVQHAIRVRDVAPVMGLAFDQATCTVCQQLSTFIDGLRKDGRFEVGDDLRIGRLTARPKGTGFEVSGTFVYPRSEDVDIHGKNEGTTAADSHDLVVDLTWDAPRSRWRLLDYSFKISGKAG